ncbi:MAG: DegT/DnrJ/EryC1/StrS family aminotransferase [Pirellulales bacterium]|nr:DegT/DnrJ/EryC1/StrS family aminotransferase [Pirellulales bacterium]
MTLSWPCEYPGTHWFDEEEERAVLDVLRSRSLFRYYGPGKPKYVDALEAAARDFYGTRHALAVNSGSGALITALSALETGPGDEVIIPALMWVATAAAVVQCNAIPVLCEVDDGFNMDPADLEQKITPRTKLILPVHMAGSPCDMDAIMAAADRHGIRVLEDCAQANGGTFRGRKLGTFGAMGIYSFQLNKNMTAGEGGLIVTDDERLYLRAFSAHDMSLLWRNGQPSDPEPEVLAWAGGRRMSELCGAVASIQLLKLPRIVAHMRASHRRICAALEGVPGLQLRRLNDAEGDTGPFLVFLLENEAGAIRVLERMKAAGLHSAYRLADYGLHVYYNIATLANKVPLSAAGNPWTLGQNAQSVYDYRKGACPRSDALFARSILLPIPSCLTEEQEAAAVQVIKAAVSTEAPLA